MVPLPLRAAIRVVAVLAALATAAPVSAAPCAESDKACLAKAIRAHPLRLAERWRDILRLPDGARYAPAPPGLVDYLTMDNAANGYPERPRAATLEADFRRDVDAAMDGLPSAVWDLLAKRLAGIYFVEDLGGTGYSDILIDANGMPMAGYIVFDASVLRGKHANAWATWKENTPFKADPAWRLTACIEEDADDNRVQAIQYILLHELAHVLSIGGDLHARWDKPLRDLDRHARYRFADLSWRLDARTWTWTSIYDNAFPQRRKVAYYFGARLAGADMLPTYRALRQTNFPSLYAATSPGDDFAESFASYVHVVMLKRPWRILIERHGKAQFELDACWDAPRCAAKRAQLEALFAE